MQKINSLVKEARRQGYDEALQALINFSVAYDFTELTAEQCKLLADCRLVEYDKEKSGYAVSREVVEWARYFADVKESGRFGAIRGLLRKTYLQDPERVRGLESLLLNIVNQPMLEVPHLREMDLIWQCGDTYVLRPDVTCLFREYFKGLPAGRVTLHVTVQGSTELC